MPQETLFLVARDDLRSHRLADREVPALAPGQTLLRVEKVALTANTITYAAFGDRMRYWDFFPAGVDGQGRPPAWGFLEVVESRADGVAPGDRFYGYAPIGTHLIVAPQRVASTGFVDASAHRQHLAPVYNAYARVDAADAAEEAMRMLLAPLFTTSFVLDAHLAQAREFGADQVIVSSASSKTCIGMAYLLHQRGVPVIGFTSKRNVPFCEGLGVYRAVLPYEGVTDLAPAPSAYVDFAGAGAFRVALHEHFREALVADIGVGATAWDAAAPAPENLPGAAPSFFFAPDVIKARVAEWGRAAYEEKLAAATAAFFAEAKTWLKVREAGREDVPRLWNDAVEGRIAPDDGIVLRF